MQGGFAVSLLREWFSPARVAVSVGLMAGAWGWQLVLGGWGLGAGGGWCLWGLGAGGCGGWQLVAVVAGAGAQPRRASLGVW